MQTVELGASYSHHLPNGLMPILLLQTYKGRQKDCFCAETMFPMGTFLIFEKNGRKPPVLASTSLLRKIALIKHPEQIGKLEFQTLTSTLSEAKSKTPGSFPHTSF